jgi:hypothetical protein
MNVARHEQTFTLRDAIVAGAAAALGTLIADDMLGALAAALLWAIWRYLANAGGVPILAAALSFQWMQVTVGIWYHGLTGRSVDTMVKSDYRPMVFIGLGCVAALALGLRAGIALLERRHGPAPFRDFNALGWPTLIFAYVATTGLQGAVGFYAYLVPGLTQPILALRFIRLGIVFLIMRRLTIPEIRIVPMMSVVILEVLFGLTGFFAGFREPLVMVAVAVYGGFKPRSFRHWMVAGTLAVLMAGLATMWMSIRRDYRSSFEDENFAASRERQLDRIGELGSTWWRESRDPGETDRLVDRMWTVYYPALAVSRVPSTLPHTSGALMSAALTHVFNPRLFFPTKAELQSDSEMVRKYSGVWVAGTEQNTSIAFGYAAEAYIDYGVPTMFIPVFIYGLFMGLAFQFLTFRLSHVELRAALLTVVFWLTLYLFERSWVKTLGLAGTLLIYLGLPALLVDQYLSRWEVRRDRDRIPDIYVASELR